MVAPIEVDKYRMANMEVKNFFIIGPRARSGTKLYLITTKFRLKFQE